MRFGSAGYLWLLVLVPAVAFFLWWALGWRRDLMARFATEKVLSRMGLLRNVLIEWTRFGLLLLGMVCLVFALARPQWGYHERQVVTQGVDLMIAIDTSASMMARDFPPSRLTRAKELLRNLIWEAKGDRVGIVAFAGSAAVMCPLTLDYNMAVTALEAVDMNSVSARGTNIGAAIAAANGAFEVSGANDRVLVLLTDGEQLERLNDLETALQKAKQQGVKIYALGMGSTEGSTIPTMRGPLRDKQGNVVDTKLDFELLERLAEETGGQAIRAEKTGAAEVAQVAAELSQFRGRKQQDKTFRVYHERYPWFVGAALLCLVMEALLRGYRGRLGRRDEMMRGAAVLVAGFLVWGASAPVFAYPGETYVRSRSGLQEYRAGKYDEAVGEYRQAAELDPEDPRLTYNLGASAAKAGNTSEAMSLLRTVYDPENPELNINARYGLATLEHREARREIAEKRDSWEQELAAGGDEARAEVEGMIERLNRVIREYQEVLLEKPNDVDVKANFELAKRDLAELERLLQEHSQEEQQQQQEQPQENEQQQEEQQQGEGEEGESGQDDQQKEQDEQEGEQDEQQNEDEQQPGEEGKQEQQDESQGEGESEQPREGEPGQQDGEQGSDGDQQQPTPTPSPQGTPSQPQPTPQPTATPSPSPTPQPGESGSAGPGNEQVPVGEMSPTDVDRLLNTLPDENQQALQLMMGAPTESEDMEHEW